MACGTCGIEGHNRRTCKGKVEPKQKAEPKPKQKSKPKTTSILKEEEQPKVSTTMNAEDIMYFFRSMKGEGRSQNDAINKKRETVLNAVLNDVHYSEDEEHGRYWKLLRDRLCAAAKEICPGGGELVKMEHKGGRAWNYDYQFTYSKGSVVKVEYKYGESSIQSLPQFYQKETNAAFLPGFAEAYYDSVVTSHPLYSEKSVGISVPTRAAYMKEVYKNDSKNPYFVRLKEKTKTSTDFYEQLKDVATPFLKEWLGKHYKNIDCGLLGKLLKERQSGKVYLLWKEGEFHVERIADEEFCGDLSIVGVGEKGNTLIICSGTGAYEFHMLLRWKNGIGLLKPAWQISLKGTGAPAAN